MDKLEYLKVLLDAEEKGGRYISRITHRINAVCNSIEKDFDIVSKPKDPENE